MPKKRTNYRYKRGYLVAILIGFEKQRAVLWRIFSEVIKPLDIIKLSKPQEMLVENELYNFHEAIINILRPLIREGIRSVILSAPKNTDYSQALLNHVQKHHTWLSRETSANSLSFGRLVGSASTIKEVSELVQTKEFKEVVNDTTTEEADNIIEILEERLNEVARGEVVLYSLKAIEELTYGQWKYGKRKPEYVLLTDRFLKKTKQKRRVQRLLQILKNKSIKVKVVDAETAAGERISQFGGLVCFTEVINGE